MIDPVPLFGILSFTLQFGLIAQYRNQRVRKDRLWRFCDMTRVSDEKASFSQLMSQRRRKHPGPTGLPPRGSW